MRCDNADALMHTVNNSPQQQTHNDTAVYPAYHYHLCCAVQTAFMTAAARNPSSMPSCQKSSCSCCPLLLPPCCWPWLLLLLPHGSEESSCCSAYGTACACSSSTGNVKCNAVLSVGDPTVSAVGGQLARNIYRWRVR